MKKKIWILVISVILILTFSGSIIAKEVLSAKIELKDGSVIIGEVQKPLTILVETKQGELKIELKDIVSIQFSTETSFTKEISSVKSGSFELKQIKYLIITVTGNRTEGYEKFVEEMEKVIPDVCRWGSRSLVDFTEIEEDMKAIKDSYTIFLLRPDNIEQLKDLKAKYPNLVPCSYAKLKVYLKFNPCLFYFFYDAQTDKIRGIIIAEKVDASLVKLLVEKELPLDTLFQYKDGQLKEIEKK
jgi:membrane-associated HD superfamily phosphohydrolase